MRAQSSNFPDFCKSMDLIYSESSKLGSNKLGKLHAEPVLAYDSSKKYYFLFPDVKNTF